MKHTGTVVLLTTALLATACGPGRKSAWERSHEKTQPGVAETPEEDFAAKMAEAEQAWQNRGERASLEQAIGTWEQLTEARPGNAELLAKLSHAYYFLADGYMRLAGEDDAMLETFEKSVLTGEKAMLAISKPFAEAVEGGAKVEEAVQLIPKEGQSAIYWYAAALGKFAVLKGFTTQLFYKDRIFAVMQHVLSLDETFLHAAPHRYFGAFYAKAPSFAGGDMTKSKEHFERALALDDRYLGTKVLYAEYYAIKAEERPLFERLLNEVISADPQILPELVPEQKIEQDKARDLLAKANEIF